MRTRTSFFAYLPAILFVALSAAHGIEGLRHDWSWIPESAGFISSAFATLVWRPDGVGSARPYPTDYLLALFDAAMVLVIGVKAFFPLFLLMMAALCVYGARSLAAVLEAPVGARFGLSLFALFNPWVYTEFVAGHHGMIVAYGATMAYLGESLKLKPRAGVCALLICASAAQLQLFLILVAFAAYLAVSRRIFLPLATGIIVALPTIIGILGSESTLAAISYNLPWASLQSLRPIEAAALTGYFADYVAGFTPVAFDAVWAMLALSIIGLVLTKRKTIAFGFLFLGGIAWLWSTGVHGPIAAVYAAAIIRISALQLFRESYDLLAYVAIAYVALAAMAAGTHRILAATIVVPGLVLAMSWCLAPPSRWLVPLRDLPQVTVSAPAQTRLAFMPDVQPLTFDGRGSGLDPNAYPRARNVMTLNGLDETYPADVALRRFALTGDVSALEGLGVSQIVSRPWLATDAHSAAATSALKGDFPWQRHSGTTALTPMPELSAIARIRVTPVPPEIGSAAIFFGDAAAMSGAGVPASWRSFERPKIIVASRSALRASDAWVDVRLAYRSQPEIGQGLGGVITTSRKASVMLEPGRTALVRIRGRLVAEDGSLISGTTPNYRWVPVARGVDRARCEGECIVVAQGLVPGWLRPEADPVHVQAIAFNSLVPWLVVATLTPHASTELLRYATGFDPNWLALTTNGIFAHVRVETALNGWIVPAQPQAQSVLLIESVAATQQLCEFIAILWTFYVAYGVLQASPGLFSKATH